MTRIPFITLAALGLLTLGALSVGAQPRGGDTELDRARRELRDAERALDRALADKAAAREAFDRLKAHKGRLQDDLEAYRAHLADSRRGVDAIRDVVARKQIEHDRLAADVAALNLRVAELDKRVVDSRHYADALRERFTREFEASREFRLAAGDADRAKAMVEQANADVMRNIARVPQYRWAESDLRFYEEEVRRLRAARNPDPRRLAEAQRAAEDARRRIDQIVGDALAADPEVRRATGRLVEAEARLAGLKAGFAADLERRRELRDAAVMIATAEHDAARTRQDLAGAQARCSVVRAELDRHIANLVGADRISAGAARELDRRQVELKKSADAVFAAQDDFRRAGERETAARADIERAARRVEWLAKRR